MGGSYTFLASARFNSFFLILTSFLLPSSITRRSAGPLAQKYARFILTFVSVFRCYEAPCFDRSFLIRRSTVGHNPGRAS